MAAYILGGEDGVDEDEALEDLACGQSAGNVIDDSGMSGPAAMDAEEIGVLRDEDAPFSGGEGKLTEIIGLPKLPLGSRGHVDASPA